MEAIMTPRKYLTAAAAAAMLTVGSAAAGADEIRSGNLNLYTAKAPTTIQGKPAAQVIGDKVIDAEGREIGSVNFVAADAAGVARGVTVVVQTPLGLGERTVLLDVSRVRSVGHSAAGSVLPMQGQHEAQNHYPQASAGGRRDPRASVDKRRGTLRSAALPQTHRAAPVREGSQP
jgi:hypothetical protein